MYRLLYIYINKYSCVYEFNAISLFSLLVKRLVVRVWHRWIMIPLTVSTTKYLPDSDHNGSLCYGSSSIIFFELNLLKTHLSIARIGKHIILPNPDFACRWNDNMFCRIMRYDFSACFKQYWWYRTFVIYYMTSHSISNFYRCFLNALMLTFSQ